MATVVLPAPPFWLIMAIVFMLVRWSVAPFATMRVNTKTIKRKARAGEKEGRGTLLHANLEICVILVILEKRKSLFP
jgi:hypothetical protein